MGIHRPKRLRYSNATPLLFLAALLCGTSLAIAADRTPDRPGFAVVRSQSPDAVTETARLPGATPFIESYNYPENQQFEQSFQTGTASLHSPPTSVQSYRPPICPAPPCSDARRKLYNMVQKFKGDSAYPHCPPYRAPGTYGYNVPCWRRLPELSPCCFREDQIAVPLPAAPPASPTPLPPPHPHSIVIPSKTEVHRTMQQSSLRRHVAITRV